MTFQINDIYCSFLSLKFKKAVIWLVLTVSIFLIFLIATVQVSTKFEAKRKIQDTWIHTNLKYLHQILQCIVQARTI